ncbi:MAG TPA: hypothetical protein IAA98_05310 [Candidatus Avipropionibacterium avicola]|uniref:Uncharacterized protein n=1 Tax=Candidatus Avipropionibacterium avicola TaxID=2840701 RepID=A0A9D1GX25_9ACTN|nr:hypothetical protein [Candidatus Avipropionibacterium avicola]
MPQPLTRRPWSELPGEPAGPRARQVRERIDLAQTRLHHPSTDEATAAAVRLRGDLLARGATRVDLVPVGWDDQPTRAPGSASDATKDAEDEAVVDVLLGGLSSNPRIAELYHAWLCPVDASFPGVGGHYLRVHQDLAGDGRASVVVGVSALSDLDAAVERLLGHLDGGTTLAQVHDVQVSEQCRAGHPWFDPEDAVHDGFREAAREAYRTQTHRGATPYLSHAGDMLAATGDRRFAQLYLDIAQDMVLDTADWQPDQWGRWGFDADFQAARVISSWHAIADSVWFTDEDRARIAGHLVAYLGNSEDQWQGHRDSPYPARQNHFTFAALGLMFAALLLGPVHRLARTEQWWEMVDECFTPMLTAGKSCEDCEAYGWHTFGHVIRYALLRPVTDYFDDGACARVLDRSVVTMDNLGGQVPYGDAAAHRGSFSEMEFWRCAGWVLDDPRWAAVVDKKLAAVGDAGNGAVTGIAGVLHHYDRVEGSDLSGLSDHLGLAVLELDEGYCQTYADVDPVPDAGFDKISLRTGFDPEDSYLLLDGIDNGSHGHRDIGAILRYTSRDRIWLEDAEYDKVAANFHNTVLIARDGLTGPRRPYAELGEVTTIADRGCGSIEVARCRVPDQSGADWDRTVIGLGRHGVAVVDRVTARQAGDYEVTALWRTVGQTRLEGDRWTIVMGEQDLPIHTVVVSDGRRRRREINEDYVSYRPVWRDYPWAEESETVLQDTTTRHLEPGESVAYVHLIADGDQRDNAWIAVDTAGTVIGRVGDGELRLDPADPSRTTWTPVEHWQIEAGPGPVLPLGDLIATSDGDRVQLWRDGTSVLDFAATAPISALAAGPDDSIVVGQHDGIVELYGLDGTRRWRFDFDAHMGHQARVNALTVGAFASGPVILVGTESCHVHVLTQQGEQLWQHEVIHACAAVAAADLDGDGEDEVYAITEYWTWHGLDSSGTPRFSVRGKESEGGRIVLGHRGQAIFGGWDGHLTAYRPDGSEAWDLSVGDVITTVVTDGDDLVVASRAGRLHRVTADGEQLWWQARPVEAMVATGGGVAVASGRSLSWLDSGGRTVRSVPLSSEAVALWSTAEGVVVHDRRGVVSGPFS